MNKIKKFIKKQKFAIGLVVGALVFTGLPVFADGGSIFERIIDRAGQLVAGNINEKINASGVLDNITIEDLELGAMPGNEIQGPEFIVNGLKTHFDGASLVSATSSAYNIVCKKKSPNATSTLVLDGSTSIKFTVSSTTSATVGLYKSATNAATTTIIGNAITIAANAQDTIIASTTAAQELTETQVIAPNQWLLWNMQGGVGTMSPTGTCNAKFVIN